MSLSVCNLSAALNLKVGFLSLDYSTPCLDFDRSILYLRVSDLDLVYVVGKLESVVGMRSTCFLSTLFKVEIESSFLLTLCITLKL